MADDCKRRMESVACDNVARMRWSNHACSANLLIRDFAFGAVWRNEGTWKAAARTKMRFNVGDISVSALGSYRRRCDAKRAVELALSGGAAPMPGYVHPRSDRGFGHPWLMNERGASVFRRHLRKEKRKARRERRRGRR